MLDQKSLSAKDISVIIRACKSSGVRKLQYQDLLIELGSESKPEDSPSIIHYKTSEVEIPQPDAPKFGPLPITEPEEIQEELLSITDPAIYEERLMNGDLEENQDG